jgi:hypothetical protein
MLDAELSHNELTQRLGFTGHLGADKSKWKRALAEKILPPF